MIHAYQAAVKTMGGVALNDDAYRATLNGLHAQLADHLAQQKAAAQDAQVVRERIGRLRAMRRQQLRAAR